jgi:hypothetical protein
MAATAMTTAHRTSGASPLAVHFSAVDRAEWSVSSAITGVTVIDVDNGNAAGNGTLTFTASGETLAWTPPGGSIGTAVPVGSADGPYDLYGADGLTMVRVYVDESALPGGDDTATVAVTKISTGVAQPPSWCRSTNNVTGVRLVYCKTGHGTGSKYDLVLNDTVTPNTLSWGGGSAVDVSAGGYFTLTASDGSQVEVHVTPGDFPGVSGPHTDSVGVTNGGRNSNYGWWLYKWIFPERESDGNWTHTGFPKWYGGPDAITANLYETEGSYKCQLQVIDEDGGNVLGDGNWYEEAITVADPTWTDIYVDATSGNDTTGDGSIGSPYQTIGKANTEVAGANTRILLKRGETFNHSGTLEVGGTVDGPIQVQPYGTGADPVVKDDEAASGGVFIQIDYDDRRLIDVTVEGTEATAGKRVMQELTLVVVAALCCVVTRQKAPPICLFLATPAMSPRGNLASVAIAATTRFFPMGLTGWLRWMLGWGIF